MRAPNPSGRLEPTRARHANVHQHDVGQEIRGELDRFDAVGCLADDLDVVLLREHLLEPTPKQRVVVHDENANRLIGRHAG